MYLDDNLLRLGIKEGESLETMPVEWGLLLSCLADKATNAVSDNPHVF